MTGENIETQLQALEESFGETSSFTTAFRAELESIRAEMAGTERETSRLSRSLGTSLKSAFQSVVFDGAKVSDVLLKIGKDMAGNVFSQALRPVQNALGSAVSQGVGGLLGGILPFANGGVIGSGRVRAFANGGIVNGPVSFPMRGGMGLMGEAGPEAIMPLARGPDGKLGVRGGGGGGSVNVTMNISTPDAAGFRRSRTQVAAEMSRALQRSRRNL